MENVGTSYQIRYKGTDIPQIMQGKTFLKLFQEVISSANIGI